MLPQHWASNVFAKPAAVGALAAIGALAIDKLSGEDAKPLKLLGKVPLPFPLAAFLAAGGATALTEAAHEFVFPKIPYIDRYAKLETMALEPLLAGAFFYGLLRAAGYGSRPVLPPVLLGAGSVVIGSYGFDAMTQSKTRRGR